MWTDTSDKWEKERGFGSYAFETTDESGRIGMAWIISIGDKHVVQWLRGRGLQRGENRELKPGKKTIHGTIQRAKAFAEKAVADEFIRQQEYDREVNNGH